MIKSCYLQCDLFTVLVFNSYWLVMYIIYIVTKYAHIGIVYSTTAQHLNVTQLTKNSTFLNWENLLKETIFILRNEMLVVCYAVHNKYVLYTVCLCKETG